MNILVSCICTPNYAEYARKVLEAFDKNITNPEGHNIKYEVRSYNAFPEYDKFAFMNDWHKGTKISLWRFSIYQDCEYDRIILLDADMTIEGNLDLLISEKLNDKPFYACKDYGCPHYYKDRIPEYLKGKLFNGGLQIINKPLLKDGFLKDLVIGESFDGSDQGYLLNYFYNKGIEIGYLPDEYNYAFQDSYYSKLDKCIIRHWTGRKPWE